MAAYIDGGRVRAFDATENQTTTQTGSAHSSDTVVWRDQSLRLLCERHDILPFEYHAANDMFMFTRYESDGQSHVLALPHFTERLASEKSVNHRYAGIVEHARDYVNSIESGEPFECRIDFPTAIYQTRGSENGQLQDILVFGDGPRWWRLTFVSMEDADGAFQGIVGVATDIQKEKESETVLNASHKARTEFMRSLTIGALLAVEFDTLSGKRVALEGDTLPDFLPADTTFPEFVKMLENHAVTAAGRASIDSCVGSAALAHVKYKGYEKVNVDCLMTPLDGTGGEPRWYGLTFHYTTDDANERSYVFIYLIDIDDKKRAHLALIAQTSQDPLTGLLNRTAFMSYCRGYFAAHKDDPAPENGLPNGALVLLEIDSFNLLNERQGHAYVDRLLQKTADTLRAVARERDKAAHFGGARFALYLGRSDSLDRSFMLNRVRVINAVFTRPSDEKDRATMSIGAALYPCDGRTLDVLYDRADRAIAHSKNIGGGTYTFYSHALDNMPPARGETMVSKSDIWPTKRARIRTFGYFDVFVDEQPIQFSSAKSKELLALLVDRQGGYVTAAEAISCLWENESADPTTLSRYRKVALRLRRTLEEHGIGDIIESHNGTRRIVPEKVDCDLFNYLSGLSNYSKLFSGAYLNNYSWGESTLATLLKL